MLLNIFLSTCECKICETQNELNKHWCNCYIVVGVICSAPIMDGWYRAQVTAVYEGPDECDIKYVDYGGFSRVPGSVLRQIR